MSIPKINLYFKEKSQILMFKETLCLRANAFLSVPLMGSH